MHARCTSHLINGQRKKAGKKERENVAPCTEGLMCYVGHVQGVHRGGLLGGGGCDPEGWNCRQVYDLPLYLATSVRYSPPYMAH